MLTLKKDASVFDHWSAVIPPSKSFLVWHFFTIRCLDQLLNKDKVVLYRVCPKACETL